MEFEKGSDEHIAFLETREAAAVKAATDAATEAKARADAAEKRAKELPARIKARKAYVEVFAKARDAVQARGARWDAPLPSEDPEAADAPNVIKDALALLAPDFKPTKDDPAFLEGALMAFVHALKAEAVDEVADDEMYDAEPLMPGDTAPGVNPGEPGRQDGRRQRVDDGEPDAYAARSRMLHATENAWRRGAEKKAS